MANTYEAIATQTLGSATASVTFSSIPSTYTDLILVGSPINGGTYYVQFNGDTTSGLYSDTMLSGRNSGLTASARQTAQNKMVAGMYFDGTGATSTSPATQFVHIMNYSNTTTYKTALTRAGGIGSTSETTAVVGLWRNTAAINSILITTDYTTFAIGSTFSLYGIKAA